MNVALLAFVKTFGVGWEMSFWPDYVCSLIGGPSQLAWLCYLLAHSSGARRSSRLQPG